MNLRRSRKNLTTRISRALLQGRGKQAKSLSTLLCFPLLTIKSREASKRSKRWMLASSSLIFELRFLENINLWTSILSKAGTLDPMLIRTLLRLQQTKTILILISILKLNILKFQLPLQLWAISLQTKMERKK